MHGPINIRSTWLFERYWTREPVCACESCQVCGEPCFAGAAISRDGFIQQIRRRGWHKSLQA